MSLYASSYGGSNRGPSYGEGVQDGIPTVRATHNDGRMGQPNAQGIPQTTAKRGRTPGTKVIKTCQGCNHLIAAALTKCPKCGHVYREKKQKGTKSGKRGRKLCPQCEQDSPAASAACRSCHFKFRLKIKERYGPGAAPRPNQQNAPPARRANHVNTAMHNSNQNPNMQQYIGIPGMSGSALSIRDQGAHQTGLGGLGGGTNFQGLPGGGAGLLHSNNYSGIPGSGSNNGAGSFPVQGRRGAGGYSVQGGQGGMHSLSNLTTGGQGLPGHVAGSIGGLTGLGLTGMTHMNQYGRAGTGEQDNVHSIGQPQRYNGM